MGQLLLFPSLQHEMFILRFILQPQIYKIVSEAVWVRWEACLLVTLSSIHLKYFNLFYLFFVLFFLDRLEIIIQKSQVLLHSNVIIEMILDETRI